MTKEQAYALASQWGSYMNDSDPGACFYAFHTNDGRPQDEDHRAQCIAHTDACINLFAGKKLGRVRLTEKLELQALRRFFVETPLRAENQNV